MDQTKINQFNTISFLSLCLFIMNLATGPLFAQETLLAQEKEPSWIDKNMEISGYVKYLNTTTVLSLDEMISDNLIHNRVNLKLYLNEGLEFDLQLRNRAFWGAAVSFNPFYKSSIDSDEKEIDLSTFIIDRDALLLHSEIDRLSLSYSAGAWDFVIGRQRINWGKNLVWNPNDLFNAYNFIDVDYEERPGSDAVSAQYNMKDDALVQGVYAYGENIDESIIALRYQFNFKEYDIQLLTANYYEDFMIGTGWEGYIGGGGFKGEISYFTPKSAFADNSSVITGSISGDYFFKNGVSLISGVLYNNQGLDSISSLDLTGLTSDRLSAKMLMPNRWSLFAQVGLPFNAALSGSTAIIYAHELRAMFIMPSLAYAIKENWDIDLIAQIFVGHDGDKVANVGNVVLLRMRYSY